MNFIQKRIILCMAYIAIFFIFSKLTIAGIAYYFSDQMNFQPNEARNHNHEITFTGNLTIDPPEGFTLSNYTDGLTLNGDNMIWNSTTSKTVNFTLVSVDNCTEGDIFESKIYIDDTFHDKFTYVCIPDNKIIDFKVEYGHGDANYLSNNELYISNESATLFNLVRVWNIGHYLDPNEPATDATIECTFERNYPVRTYGRTNITYSDGSIASKFYWTSIEGGYWFRIGVVSQDVRDKAVGDYYNVSCGNLTYKYRHQQVQSGFPDYGLEVRTIKPFNITTEDVSATKSKYIINNTEEYPVYFIYFDRLVNGYTKTEYIPKLESGKYVQYETDKTGDYNLTIFFIPSWYRNSRNPRYYTQEYGFVELEEEISPEVGGVPTADGTSGGSGLAGRRTKIPTPPPEGKEIQRECTSWSNCSKYGLQTRSCEVVKEINGKTKTETIWEDQVCEYIPLEEELKIEIPLARPKKGLLTSVSQFIQYMLLLRPKKATLYIILGILALLFSGLLYYLLIPKVVLDKSALRYIIKGKIPIKELLQNKFGKKISILIPYDTFETLLKERKKTSKKAIQWIIESNFKTFKTKNLIKWARWHRAIIVTADLKKYREKNVKIYYLTKRAKIKSKLKQMEKTLKEKKEKLGLKKGIKEVLERSDIVLLLLSRVERYTHKIIPILKKLIRKKKIIYVSYGKTSKHIKRILHKQKINLKDLVFINCVNIKSKEDININPENLTEISLAITGAVEKLKNAVVIVDTISAFSLHHYEDVIIRFMVSMNDKARNENYKILWIAVDDPSKKVFNNTLVKFCDEVIKL